MAKYFLKTTPTFGSKIKHWRLMQWRTTVTGVKVRRRRKSVLHYIVCRCWSWNWHFNTHNVRPRNISAPLTPKTKLRDNQFYMNCVKRYLLCANRWLRQCFDSSCTWMKASKLLTVSVSVFRGQISWRFSLSKNNISPAASDLELILFVPLWYWPIMNAHTKQQQDKVFQTDFIDSQKSDPPICAPFGTICVWIDFCIFDLRKTLHRNHTGEELWIVHSIMTESDHPEMTSCGWQYVKIQLLFFFLFFFPFPCNFQICDQHFFNPCCANARDCENGMNDHPATGGASQPEEQTAFMSTDANEDASSTSSLFLSFFRRPRLLWTAARTTPTVKMVWMTTRLQVEHRSLKSRLHSWVLMPTRMPASDAWMAIGQGSSIPWRDSE